MPEVHHCGCCGNVIDAATYRRRDPIWCHRCPGHLLSPTDEVGNPRKLHERTYEAQFGVPCPYAVSMTDLREKLR